jgi:RND family efflux transporter MFP subunit
MRSGILRTGVLAAVLLIGCGQQKPPPAPQPPPVTVAKPVTKEITEYSVYTGRMAAVEYVDIRPRVSGYITNITFKEGDIVNQGDLLFVIDSRPYEAELEQAKGQLRLAEAQRQLAEANFARADRLFRTYVSSKEEFDTSLAQKSQAEAQVISAQATVNAAQLNLDFTEITAPVTGRISREQVTIGNLVQTDQTLLTNIVSVDPIYAYADVDERTVLNYQQLVREGKVKSARESEVPVAIALANEKDFPHKGVIDFVDNQINRATGTLQIRGRLPNPGGGLLPGMFVRVQIPTSPAFNAVLVADQAISSDQGLKFVYVMTPDKIAKLTRVSLGPLVDGLRVVHTGVKPEDEVIVNGLVKVRPDSPVTPEQGDMRKFGSDQLNVDVVTGSPPSASNNKTGQGGAETTAQAGAKASSRQGAE